MTPRGDTAVLQAVAEMLAENKTLQSLNIESNFITSAGMMSVIKAMYQNSTLSELKVDNQVGMGNHRDQEGLGGGVVRMGGPILPHGTAACSASAWGTRWRWRWRRCWSSAPPSCASGTISHSKAPAPAPPSPSPATTNSVSAPRGEMGRNQGLNGISGPDLPLPRPRSQAEENLSVPHHGPLEPGARLTLRLCFGSLGPDPL